MTSRDEGPDGRGAESRQDPSSRFGLPLDAAALKTLAHPLRYRLLETLIELGPSTASALGRIVGENSGSTSYHLRQLAAHGLIEEATELGTARDRYWRSIEGGYSIHGFDMLQREDTREAATFVLDNVFRDRADRLTRWHADAPRWGKAWVDATTDSTYRMRLTRQQMGALRDELQDVIERYRRQAVADDVPESARIAVQLDVFPIEEPPGDPGDPSEDGAGTSEDSPADEAGDASTARG